MKQKYFNKMLVCAAIVGGLFLTYSCKESKEEEEEVNFTSTDLIGKYWYSNIWLDSPDRYDIADGLQVLRFEYDGTLKFQEYSGKRDTVIGSWKMNGNELTINDQRNTSNPEQKWYIVAPSQPTHLKLNSGIGGNRDYYTEIEDLNGFSADARIINEYESSVKEGYRYEFDLRGNDIKESKVILQNKTYNLQELSTGVWGLGNEDAYTYFSQFAGKEKMRFYVEFNSGLKMKVDEYIYSKSLERLDHRNIIVTHATETSEIGVSWSTLTDDQVRYQVEVLNSNRDEANPVFVSFIQPANTETLEINSSTGFFVNKLENLVSGEEFYVKIVAFCYEPEIDIVNGINKATNIQAKSQYIYKMAQW